MLVFGVKLEMIKSHCNKCNGVTNQHVKADYKDSGEEVDSGYYHFKWTNDWKIIQCAGCEEVSARHVFDFSEADRETIQLYPAKISRRMPLWLNNWTTRLDNVLEDLFRELYIAHQGEAYYLSSMGTRAIIDRIMKISMKRDQGTFEQRLDRFHKEGMISEDEITLVKVVIEAGNASSHRGWSPKEKQQLETLIEIIENLTERLFVLKKKGIALKKQIPKKRAGKKNKTTGKQV